MTTNREQVSWPVSRGLFGRFSGWLIGRKADRARLAKAFALYHVIVARARQERFYAEWGVPDTADGRLEMIGAHAALFIRRLRREGEAGQTLSQDIFDVMFADVDRNIREQGVGDLSVGKHVKRAARTFLARCQALDPCLDGGDAADIGRVLERNIFNRVGDVAAATGRGAEAPPAEAGEPGSLPPGMLALGGYLIAEEARLAGVPGAELLAGRCPPAEPAPPAKIAVAAASSMARSPAG
jgi:cytochrome b pre-mRNA-processing protein 3